MREFVVLIALLLIRAPAALLAQPAQESGSDPRLDSAGSTSIPVRMPYGTEVMGAEASGTSTAAPAIAVDEPLDPNTYICSAGDTLELNFWGQQNFRLRLAVDLEGRAFISKVGFVSVAGKSLSTVRADITKKVRANYPGLQFAVTLVAPRTFLVHVADNVKRPGSYTANPLERVSAVLTRAGGITGSRRKIQIRRKATTLQADLLMYELTGNTQHNPHVLDGDVIVVPFEELVVSVFGATRRQGAFELTATKDLKELFQLAGGFTNAAVYSLPIRVVRRDNSEHDKFTDVAFKGSDVPAFALKDGDKVYVRSSDELQRSVLMIGAVPNADTLDTATTVKRLPYIEGDSVLSLVERAGGIQSAGDLRRSYISRPNSENQPTLISLDLDALLVRRDLSADRAVKMGDTIVIPPMQYGVRVEGAVARAGIYLYNPTYGIDEYVAHAGGPTRSARDVDESRLIDPSGRTHTYSRRLKPQPGDAIVVPERNFTRAEVAQLVLAGAGLLLSGVAITLAATR